jgi:hypothetical protein
VLALRTQLLEAIRFGQLGDGEVVFDRLALGLECIDLACRSLPFLAVFHIPGFWLLNDVKKSLERVVRV